MAPSTVPGTWNLQTNNTSFIRATLELWSDDDQLIILRWSSLKQACSIDGSSPIKAAEASEQSQRDNEDVLPESCSSSIPLHAQSQSMTIKEPLIVDFDDLLCVLCSCCRQSTAHAMKAQL